MVAVYVDESVNAEEFKEIVAVAERLNVPAKKSAKLKDSLSHELSKRVQDASTIAEAPAAADGAQAARSTTSASDVGGGSRGWKIVRARVRVLAALGAEKRHAQARAANYPFLLVLSLADRNLNTALTHDNIAGTDFHRIRMIMSHLGHALDNLHSKKRIHADFKPLNAARESTWKLIDMDVSLKFGESFDTKLPSSGYCPPEVAKVLLAATDAETGVVDTNELAKYTASVAYDLWSFGVVLFHLCYGISLFNTDQNDNVSLPDLKALASWTPRLLNRKIKEANQPFTADFNAAADLIKKLLVSDPEERCKPIDEGCEISSVLKHPFFQVGSEGALSPEEKATLNEINTRAKDIQTDQKEHLKLLTTIDARTEEIEGLQRATIQLLNEHASSLRACIQVGAVMR